MAVCYDLRFPELFRDYATAGAGILFLPAAFTRTTGDANWHCLLRARAIENGAYVIAAGQCGSGPNGAMSGHSLIIDPWGCVLADADADEGFWLAAAAENPHFTRERNCAAGEVAEFEYGFPMRLSGHESEKCGRANPIFHQGPVF